MNPQLPFLFNLMTIQPALLTSELAHSDWFAADNYDVDHNIFDCYGNKQVSHVVASLSIKCKFCEAHQAVCDAQESEAIVNLQSVCLKALQWFD